MPDHIYTTHDKLVARAEKEKQLGQSGQVIWFYGLSGSGKSTIAAALERELHAASRLTKVLDGDNVRAGLNRNLGFSDDDRRENIRRIAEVAKLFAETGLITLVSFITPKRELRESAREIIGDTDLQLVYVKASFEACQARDPKGLYAKVAAGEVKQFTGKDSGFEEPTDADGDHIIDTEAADLTACVQQARSLVR
ncbi:adenylyl-sulfate kinase [Synoicihabitans lomoniglobus]|uniref:Adenylyl-sulfate kinase n=1 Tax=Synoicihabitans lomoniglobus TaxID=2909285 RepID=A0AAF0CQS8_9BACT|nr:adenylyl-sulfate kinase [Opitutaceae bacterium LMO-M01]WED66334.1 adenylyl-sulfate kinase [Opitutaceae bacterium LMO-M01]